MSLILDFPILSESFTIILAHCRSDGKLCKKIADQLIRQPSKEMKCSGSKSRSSRGIASDSSASSNPLLSTSAGSPMSEYPSILHSLCHHCFFR